MDAWEIVGLVAVVAFAVVRTAALFWKHGGPKLWEAHQRAKRTERVVRRFLE